MDKEFLGHRRRALEEEYFAKLNRALRDKLRAADEPASKPHGDVAAGELEGHGDGDNESPGCLRDKR